MKPTGPRLDRHGFPIPPDFDEAGVSDPGKAGRWNLQWVRSLLKLGIVAALLAVLWMHFDVGARLGAVLGQYHAQQAQMSAQRRDWADAIEHIDRALEWDPHDAAYLQFRASLLHNLGRHREAAAVAGELLEQKLGDRSIALNDRAYFRALGEFELPEALADIDEALAGIGGENASFLDTRAYVLLKLGRAEEALVDVERAISLIEKERDQLEQMIRGRKLKPTDAEALRREMQGFERNLAVMYHHRGEIHEQLGDADQARKDKFTGKQLGYDPAGGLY